MLLMRKRLKYWMRLLAINKKTLNNICGYIEQRIKQILFDMTVNEIDQIDYKSTYPLQRLNCGGLCYYLKEELNSSSFTSDGLVFDVIPFSSSISDNLTYPYDHAGIGIFIEDKFVALIDPSFGINMPITERTPIRTPRWNFFIQRDDIGHFLRGKNLITNEFGDKRYFHPEQRFTKPELMLFQEMILQNKQTVFIYIMDESGKKNNLILTANKMKYYNLKWELYESDIESGKDYGNILLKLFTDLASYYGSLSLEKSFFNNLLHDITLTYSRFNKDISFAECRDF